MTYAEKNKLMKGFLNQLDSITKRLGSSTFTVEEAIDASYRLSRIREKIEKVKYQLGKDDRSVNEIESMANRTSEILNKHSLMAYI